MRGQVLGVDRVSGEGQISGEDGQRYGFRPDDWRDARGPAVGARIDFETDGARALRIFRLPEADTGSIADRQPPAEDRNKYVAALLAFFLGFFGIHRLYLGRIGSAIVMMVLAVTVVGLVVTCIWALVDMVRYLIMPDAEFARRYARQPA